jgi:hypothetical protein
MAKGDHIFSFTYFLDGDERSYEIDVNGIGDQFNMYATGVKHPAGTIEKIQQRLMVSPPQEGWSAPINWIRFQWNPVVDKKRKINESKLFARLKGSKTKFTVNVFVQVEGDSLNYDWHMRGCYVSEIIQSGKSELVTLTYTSFKSSKA